MSARERRYNTQEALEKIWSYSGDEDDFNRDESEVESYESAREEERNESDLMPLHRAKRMLSKILKKAVMMKHLLRFISIEHSQ